MTFLAHTVLPGAIAAFAVSRVRSNRTFWAVVIACAVLGSLPDTLDFVLALVGLVPRWSLYGWFHHNWPVALWWVVPITLHIVMDIPLHQFPGFNWWGSYWWAEVATWALALLFVYFAWRERSETKARGEVPADPPPLTIPEIYGVASDHYARTRNGKPGAKKPRPPRMYRKGK
jgi:hypothetical protein